MSRSTPAVARSTRRRWRPRRSTRLRAWRRSKQHSTGRIDSDDAPSLSLSFFLSLFSVFLIPPRVESWSRCPLRSLDRFSLWSRVAVVVGSSISPQRRFLRSALLPRSALKERAPHALFNLCLLSLVRFAAFLRNERDLQRQTFNYTALALLAGSNSVEIRGVENCSVLLLYCTHELGTLLNTRPRLLLGGD